MVKDSSWSTSAVRALKMRRRRDVTLDHYFACVGRNTLGRSAQRSIIWVRKAGGGGGHRLAGGQAVGTALALKRARGAPRRGLTATAIS